MKQETDIALIKRDLKYMKEAIDAIKNNIICYEDKFIKKETYDLEVGPLIKAKDKIAWLVISSVVVAVLSVVLSNTR